jgi:hypothetical protein
MKANRQDLPAHEAIDDWTIGQFIWKRRGYVEAMDLRLLLRKKVSHLNDAELQELLNDWLDHYLQNPEAYELAYGFQPDWVARAKRNKVSYPLQ